MQLTSPRAIENFIFGGNSTFTLTSLKTGKHFAYKVKRKKNEDCYFVRAHAGGINGEGGFNYAGWMKINSNRIKLTVKSHNDLDVAREALNWTLNQVRFGNMPEQLEFRHEGRCCRCNRKLTDPVSIDLGIGPECRKKG